MYVVTLAESEPVGLALAQVTKLLAPEARVLEHLSLPQSASEAELVSWFTSLSERLEDLGEGLAEEKLRRTVMVAATSSAFGSGSQSEMDPLLANCNGNLLSWLVLAFPESHWEILGRHNASHFLADLVETLFLASVEAAALFDPRGRRAELCHCLAKEGVDPQDGECVVLEDEASHAWLNAYAGYRFGRFKTWTVTRWSLAQHLLEETERGQDLDLVIEDVYLRFPDAPLHIHLSNLECRDSEYFNFPEHSAPGPFRLVISGGYGGENFIRSRRANGDGNDTPTPKETEQSNRDHIKGFKNRGAWLEKPVAGLFALGEPILRHRRRSERTNTTEEPEEHTHHSGHAAPGRLTMIAERLVNRSARLLERAVSVPDAIHAAVLARDAKQLLASRTPTLAIKALAHQHQAEVVAESMFFGVSTKIRVRERQDEFVAEIQKIFPSDGNIGEVRRWFCSAAKTMQQLMRRSYRWVSGAWEKRSKKMMGDIKRRRDAAALINEALARQFARFGQFDEEQKSLGAARANRFRLGSLRFVMRSPRNLLLAVIITWVVFAGGWYWFLRQVGIELSFLDSLIHSIIWSVAGESPEHFNKVILDLDPTHEVWDMWRVLLLAETVWSYIYLAVAAAMIVSKLTRR